jgi:hypothetical protein
MSHHYSGPDFGFPHGDARLDLTDLYAFPKPGDAGKSILIMNVHPSASVNPPRLTTGAPFALEALYELKIDTDGDAAADIAYRVRFSASEGGKLTATLRRVEGIQAAGTGDGGQAIVEGAPVSIGREARVTDAGEYRFFAGWRSDPFFFDTFLCRQRRVQHRDGSPQLRTGAQKSGPVGSHAGRRGREMGSGGQGRAAAASCLPYR